MHHTLQPVVGVKLEQVQGHHQVCQELMPLELPLVEEEVSRSLALVGAVGALLLLR